MNSMSFFIAFFLGLCVLLLIYETKTDKDMVKQREENKEERKEFFKKVMPSIIPSIIPTGGGGEKPEEKK
jgi:membrane-anchored glycerophosphoryl diester phosphodiesterase (GDPDase)